jgi:hypothetical protein
MARAVWIPTSLAPRRSGRALCSEARIDMPGFLIPLLIAGVVLVPLGILLWLGARERRQFLPSRDDDLGDLKLFKTYWETAAPKLLGQQALSISGVGRSTGPTPSQKSTWNFVKANADELFRLAIAAAKKAVTAAAAGLQPDDLRVSSIFLHKESNSFELSVDSESCATAMPDGIAVSFTENQIDEIEFVH